MKRSGGFTLLEVMIAVSIAAIGIVSLLELFGGSMRLARVSSEQTRAVVIASGLLDQAMWRAELPQREQEGDDGDYHWTMATKAVDPQLGFTEDDKLKDLSDEYELYEITVSVQWGGREFPKSISMKSLRVMEKF